MSDLSEQFKYLDDLRASGETNMFGAAVYVQEEFGVSRSDARLILKAWMKTFDGKASLEDRVAAVEGKL